MFKRIFGKPTQPTFAWREDGADVVVSLDKAGKKIPLDQWAVARPDVAAILPDLIASSEDGYEIEGRGIVACEDGLSFCPKALAGLDTLSAALLGLPSPTPLALDLRAQNRIDQDDFRLAVRWVRPGGQPVRAKLNGAILLTEAGPRRVPEPLWSLYSAAEPLTQALPSTERFQALAKLKQHWPDDPQLSVETEGYLQDLRVHYASSFSLKIKTLTPDVTEFDPVLFSARSVAEANDEGQVLDEEADSILSSSSQRLFATDRFRRENEARPVYVLKNGEYLFIDEALRPALGAIRRLQDAPEPQRRAFVLNPRKILRDAIGDDAAEKIGLEGLFIETEQFSDRVAGVDVWRAPVLPWIVPSQKNSWIPEKFGVRVGEDFFGISASNVAEVINRVEEAASKGEVLANVVGLLDSVDENAAPPPTQIPVNDQSRAALASLQPFVTSSEADEKRNEGEEHEASDWDAATQGKLFLVVHDNFEEVDFAPVGLTETLEDEVLEPVEPPQRLSTSLKMHQRDGLNWLAQNASVGRPGALLADDMGLGKTLQAIAFMAWLQDEAEAGRRQRAPFLIVAPTGLLGNWRAEIEKHLQAPLLGSLIPAFGGNLRLLRDEDSFGARDIETGKASLDAANWRDAGVVLTTYETLRDYHFSFARTRFGLIIFDEIQKLKNPGSQVTRAAKALNAEFTLGMTGTPVENRLQDLWSIMDVVAPGFLGASRDFEKRHPSDDVVALARLKSQLTDPIKGRPPYMLRRLKGEVLDGMPAKHIHALEAPMPAAQANAYRELVVRAAAAGAAGTLGKGGMLNALSNMRGVSLHPTDPRQAPDDLATYAQDSARLSQTLAILQNVAEKGEKALVFVEDLAMQDRLAGLIQQHFGLRSRPIRINGGIAGHKRQSLVDAFQSQPGSFDVMILSPRAGGVGLTITAANHVIHLSRWWNPAVEDQATDRVFRIGQNRDVHVYLPMAVHPDPDLAPSSFDLRLNALIERKRNLTRDLFFPPDASDGELGDLFREVSLEREIEPGAASQKASAHEPADEVLPEASASTEEPTSVQTAPPPRAKLSLPKVAVEAQVKLWRRAAGEPRPTEEILAIFSGKHVVQVVIRDPYALGTAVSREAQIHFIADLKQAAASLESVLIEYAPEVDGDLDEVSCRRDFGSTFAAEFAGLAPRLTLGRRSKRARDDDFHDRFIEIDVRHAGSAIKRHELTIGRGLEALYNDRRQCTVTYVPPGA
ncbi:DEAD/DEAH box helicase family protein [Novosphingobium sp. FSY-8]|uniref:DEAD/DEAH box helicase family protein n=1 Tax=Novosphingobium ovatum TaxID=1908523 RepID=A0ABW9XGX7_9SPHN|nr:DEAD/DEAH box helicase [Novosphingobium ovatum]NBC37805.1 DEAD/DEAH box helicase family protein [Novosphingobium ovatum]